MQTIIFEDLEKLSEAVANEILDLLSQKPDAAICLASGNSPLMAYQFFVKKVLESKLDLNKATFIELDEWIGIPPDNIGSCHYFLQTNVFQPLSLKKSQIYLFDALALDIENECTKMNAIVDKNGIDLIIVGIGMNGHIGFNEPGVSTKLNAHVIDLDEVTQAVGQKYFEKKTSITKGITLGLNQFMNAKKAIMMANGTHKAEIIHKTVNIKPTKNIPSTIIQNHKNSFLMIDKEAAKNLINN
jgi:glucosamine-6-phosphate isomerase